MIRAGVDDPSALDPTAAAGEAKAVRRLKGRKTGAKRGQSREAAESSAKSDVSDVDVSDVDARLGIDIEEALDEAIEEALEQVADDDTDDDTDDVIDADVEEDEDNAEDNTPGADLDDEFEDEDDEEDDPYEFDLREDDEELEEEDDEEVDSAEDEPDEEDVVEETDAEEDASEEETSVEDDTESPQADLAASDDESATGESQDSSEETEEEPPPALTVDELEKAIESVLFATAEPMTVRQLAELFEASVHDVREAVENLRTVLDDSGRSFQLQEVAGGLQLLTQPQYHVWISRLLKKRREQKISAAAMETLAVIAYKQPISKADLEDVRGVGCSPTLKTLMDRGLIKIVGREESLGRPLLYGTTDLFLESFGLASIKSLPQPEIDQREG